MDKLVIVMNLAKRAGRPLVVIAEDVGGTALVQLNVNNVHNALRSVAIKAPGFSESRTELLIDMGVVTNSVVFTQEDLDNITEENIDESLFGGSEGITVEQTSTVIVNGNGEASKVIRRAESIETMIEKAETSHEEKMLKSRLAKLTGGVGVLYVGAKSPVEAKEKRDRADDAMCAVRAAIEEGVVPGGGSALINSRNSIVELDGEERIGADIVYKALSVPAKMIAFNAGINGEVVESNIENNPDQIGYGYNAKTGEYGIMKDLGIIDPKKVTRVALESASSAAGMVLLTSCAIHK